MPEPASISSETQQHLALVQSMIDPSLGLVANFVIVAYVHTSGGEHEIVLISPDENSSLQVSSMVSSGALLAIRQAIPKSYERGH